MSKKTLAEHKAYFLNAEHLLVLANAILHSDSYKLSHKSMEPVGTQRIYANWTPRSDKYFRRDYPDFDGKVVAFGLQSFVIQELMCSWKVGFFDRPLEVVMAEIEDILFPYVGMNRSVLKHIEALHKLGFLPVRVKAVKEGTLVPIGIPMATFDNTDKAHSWTTNYIESVTSDEIWKPMTTATAAREFAKLRDRWWNETVVDHTFKQFAIHDFSYRGHSGHASAAACGAATLLYSNGTDNIAGLVFARTFYAAKPDTAMSIPASEHSVTTLGINHYATQELTGELKTLAGQLQNRLIVLGFGDEYEQALGELATIYQLLTEVYPSGLLSYVADSYDYWRVMTIIVPILKDVILRREGKLVIRPDSGDPIKVVVGELFDADLTEAVARSVSAGSVPCGHTFSLNGQYYVVLGSINKIPKGSYLPFSELLRNSFISKVNEPRWEADQHEIICPAEKGSIAVLDEIFGVVTNTKGYKELAPQIGLIYGDGITYKRARSIFEGLADKGYAASTVVLGVGSYSFAGGTRDSLGFAIKATYAEVNGVPTPIFKAPKTNLDSSKNSARGLLCLEKDADGNIVLLQNVTPEKEATGLLEDVIVDGDLKRFEEFEDIRAALGFGSKLL